MTDIMTLPKISIVTPSYNQGQFLEETIQSVLEQKYPNLEYIVIDGNSSDNSVGIIKRYEKHLTRWISEPDGGQTEAINKGLRMITGDIWAYLCSDDTYASGAFMECVRAFEQNPDAAVVYGGCNFIDTQGRVTRFKRPGPFNRRKLLKDNYIFQPSVFLRRRVLDAHGFFDESLHYVMDYEYWLRIAEQERFVWVDQILSNYRLHSSSKSIRDVLKMYGESIPIKKKYGAGFEVELDYLKFNLWGQYYYLAKRKFFDWLAQAREK